MNFCVSLTTLPSRIDNIEKTISSIKNQSIKPNKIFINLPYNFKRFKNYNFSNEQIERLNNYNLEISRCEDFGPATKLMGSIDKIKNDYDFVILLDDDHIYHNLSFEIMLKNFKKKQINYSFYLNKIFDIRHGQCSDIFLINTKFLDEIENFYRNYVETNTNMFLDDDLWFAIYLYCEKKTYIQNLIDDFRKLTNLDIVYSQNVNKDIDALNLTVHKKKFFLNRRKIQKIEYLKYKIKKLFKFN